MSFEHLKKEVKDKVDFFHADKYQSFLPVEFKTLGIKVSYMVIPSLSMSMNKHSHLQYLYNISKNKLGMEFIFLHADERQGFYKLALPFLMEVARHAQTTQNRKLIIFLQYIKKKILKLFLCSIVMQNIQIFYKGPVMRVVTCFI